MLDRQIRSYGIMPQEISALDRLTYVGHTGMGALLYEPDHTINLAKGAINLDNLANQATKVLSGETTNILAELLELNGSSAGTRPKAIIGLHKNKQNIISGTQKMQKCCDHWLVKFPNITDGMDAGAIEYVYALMAVETMSKISASTMVLGEGKKPGIDVLIKLGTLAKIPKKNINAIIEQTRDALSKWSELAKNYGVSRANIELINSKINMSNP